MTRFGCFLSSEEHDPGEIVRQRRLAEKAGFDSLWISDHFRPWLEEQGNSGFAWSIIGAPGAPVVLLSAQARGHLRCRPGCCGEAGRGRTRLARCRVALLPRLGAGMPG